jgi:soluble lytic murein transglycosylase-like protein
VSGVPGNLAPLFIANGHRCPDISPALLAAQAKQESGFNTSAHSSAGADGIAQFVPKTWKKFGHGSPDDPAEAIKAQAAYDCELANDVRHFGGDTQALMLAGYNAGAGAVAKYRGMPPYRETQHYVASIMAMIK